MNAFVLTGGGSLGSVHVGMLKALYERGIAPDLILGTSVGAINGAYVASRPQSPATAEALGEVWRGIRRSNVFPIDLWAGLVGFLGRRSYLVPDRGLRRLLMANLEFTDLGRSPIPLKVVATDAMTGEELLLERGDVVEAVLASAALPGVFPPVPWNGRFLVDGGVTNFSPIAPALEAQADNVFVLASGTACGLSGPPRGAIALYLHSTSFALTTRFVLEMRLFHDRARIVVLPPPCPMRVAPNDFSQAETLIRTSYEVASTFLDSLDPSTQPPLPAHLIRIGQHGVEAGTLLS